MDVHTQNMFWWFYSWFPLVFFLTNDFGRKKFCMSWMPSRQCQSTGWVWMFSTIAKTSIVLHVLVFCYGVSAFYEMICCSVVVLHLVFRLAVLVCWFDAMFYPSLTLDVSYCVLTTCWPAFWNWTCMPQGQAAVAGRTRVCACTHLAVTMCLADQRVQDIHQPIPVQRRIVEANRQRHQRTSALTVKKSTIWWLEQFAPALSQSQDLSQFTSRGHYEHAVFTLDRPPSALETSWNDSALYKCSLIIIIFLPSVLRSWGSLKINYAIQRWVRSSVRAVRSRQTVVQQNSIEALHQNRNPLKQITGL